MKSIYLNIDVSTSVFLIMSSLFMRKESTVVDAVEDLKNLHGEAPSINNATGILNRLVKQGRALRKGKGVRGRGRLYQLTDVGMADFNRYVDHVEYLARTGREAQKCRVHDRPSGGKIVPISASGPNADTRTASQRSRETGMV